METKKIIKSIVKLCLKEEELAAYKRLFTQILKHKSKEPFKEMYLTVMNDHNLRDVFKAIFELAPITEADIKYLSASEVARLLFVTTRTLAKWRKDGTLKATVWKGKAYYKIEVIEKTLEAGLQTNDGKPANARQM